MLVIPEGSRLLLSVLYAQQKLAEFHLLSGSPARLTRSRHPIAQTRLRDLSRHLNVPRYKYLMRHEQTDDSSTYERRCGRIGSWSSHADLSPAPGRCDRCAISQANNTCQCRVRTSVRCSFRGIRRPWWYRRSMNQRLC